MTRRRTAAVALLLMLLTSAGCARKNARVSNALPPAVAAAVPTTPVSPQAPVPAAATIDPLAGDLDEVRRYLCVQVLRCDVFFDYDRHELREDSRRALEINARFLREHPEFVVRLEGHCDERGTVEYNLSLGQHRAGSTRVYLESLGVAPGGLETLSYGKERPYCVGTDEACHEQNRRVHFEIVGRAG